MLQEPLLSCSFLLFYLFFVLLPNSWNLALGTWLLELGSWSLCPGSFSNSNTTGGTSLSALIWFSASCRCDGRKVCPSAVSRTLLSPYVSINSKAIAFNSLASITDTKYELYLPTLRNRSFSLQTPCDTGGS